MPVWVRVPLGVQRSGGGIGRRGGLKSPWAEMPVWVRVPPGAQVPTKGLQVNLRLVRLKLKS